MSRQCKACGQAKPARELVVKETLCTICNKEFSSTYKVATHMKRHQGSLDFPCSECDSRFVSTASLNKHKLSHQKSFQCELCQKSSSLRCTLPSIGCCGSCAAQNQPTCYEKIYFSKLLVVCTMSTVQATVQLKHSFYPLYIPFSYEFSASW